MKNSKFMKTLIALLVTLALTGAMVCFAGCSSDDKKSSRKDRDSKKSEKVEDEDDEDEDEDDDEDEDEDEDDDKDKKKDKDDDKDVEDEEEEETTTTTTEEEVEETEDEDEAGDKKSTNVDDEEDVDIGNLLGDVDVTADSFENKTLKELAQKYIDQDYFLMKVESDMVTDLDEAGTEISKHFVDGFIGMGGSLSASISASSDSDEDEADLSGTDFSMVMVVLFDEYKAAEDYFNTIADADVPDSEKDKIKVEETAEGKKITVDEDGEKVTVTLTDEGIVIMDTSMSMA